jgi:hypothetical protein
LTATGYDSVIFSGNYHLLKPETQRYITFHYDGVRRWNSIVEVFGDMHAEDPHAKIPSPLLKNLQETHRGLNESFARARDEKSRRYFVEDKVMIRDKEQLFYYEIFRNQIGIPNQVNLKGKKCPQCNTNVLDISTYCRTCGAYPI